MRDLRRAVLGALGLLILAVGRVRAANLPPGFEEVVYHSGGELSSPRAIAWAPDGDLWIAAGYGYVWVVRDGVRTRVAEIPVHYAGEDGITGLAVDPEYSTNHHVWIVYTAPSGTSMRLSRFTYSGATLVDEMVVVDWPNDNDQHNAGCVRFASDETLFITTGDDYLRSAASQDPHELRGKILHVNRDGSGAAGNPYLDGVAGDPRVWAIGFRNPFRFNVQPDTDNLFIADVGDGRWEEIDIGVAGGNFGWANIEGPQPPGQPGYVYPVYWYDHSDPVGAAIIGGDHAKAGDFAPEYEGDYFFADNSRDTIYRMRLDASNAPVSTEVWATDIPKPVDIHFGPDGALYYVSLYPAAIRKISYVGGANRQPVAVASVSPDNGSAPLVTLLDASASHDPDGDPMVCHWDLGDGGESSEPVVHHTYSQGVYHARLTVEDSEGGSDQTPEIRIVSGNRRPTVAIAAPQDESRYDAGQVVTYSGSGIDPEEGALPCGSFAWSVMFHHLGHTHPYLGPIQGSCGGSFTTAEGGEGSAETFYEVRLTAEDAGTPLGAVGKLSGAQSVEIRPNTSTMTFRTAPAPDLQLTLDTLPLQSPQAVMGVVNFVRRIGAVDPQLRADGHTYRWLAWSDGGAREHEIRTPAVDTTYTATFGCDVLEEASGLRLEHGTPSNALLTLRWDPVSDPCLSTHQVRYLIFTAATATPVQSPGSFPDDPPFVLLATSSAPTFTYLPGPLERWFLVVAVGSDGRDGPVGHYGP